MLNRLPAEERRAQLVEAALNRIRADIQTPGQQRPNAGMPKGSGAPPRPTSMAAPEAPAGWKYVPKPDGGFTAVEWPEDPRLRRQ